MYIIVQTGAVLKVKGNGSQLGLLWANWEELSPKICGCDVWYTLFEHFNCFCYLMIQVNVSGSSNIFLALQWLVLHTLWILFTLVGRQLVQMTSLRIFAVNWIRLVEKEGDLKSLFKKHKWVEVFWFIAATVDREHIGPIPRSVGNTLDDLYDFS